MEINSCNNRNETEKVCVSVIVPIYNGEKQLEKGLMSLAKQSLKNIEIICVNNNSTDSTLNILKAFKEVFPQKFVIINSPRNAGPGGGRNIGIKYARGEYIGFMDHDDFVHEYMFEMMYNEAKSGDYDIVKCAHYNEKDEKPVGNLEVKGSLDDDETRYRFINGGYYVWNKIFKKSLIDQMSMHFRENVPLEDADFVIEAALRAKRGSVMTYMFYFYTFAEETLSRSLTIDIGKCYNVNDQLIRSIEKRIATTPNEKVGLRICEEVKKFLLKQTLYFIWASPFLSEEYIAYFYEFSKKHIPEFYNIKYENSYDLEDLIWNNLSKDKNEAYNNLLNFRERVASGEVDDEMEKKKKSESEGVDNIT